jgi:hypothetical protein
MNTVCRVTHPRGKRNRDNSAPAITLQANHRESRMERIVSGATA